MTIQRDSADNGAGGIAVCAMARRLLTPLSASALLALSACSTTPPGEISYYLPKASTDIKISQTLVCTAASDQLIQVVTVTPVTTYTGDVKASASFKPNSVDGLFSNAELAFEYTKDGRLAGVNISTVGQAGEVVKGVIAVAKVAGLVAAASAPAGADRGPVTPLAVCDVIAKYSAKAAEEKKDDKTDEKKDDKKVAAVAPTKAADPNKPAAKAPEAKPAAGPVTLTYAVTLNYERNTDNTSKQKIVFAKDDQGQLSGGIIDIAPDANSIALHASLKEVMRGLTFQVALVGTTDLPVPTWSYPPEPSTESKTQGTAGGTSPKLDGSLSLNGLAGVMLKVTGPNSIPTVIDDRPTFWEGVVPVPLTGVKDRFSVPIPTASMFGTRKFSLSLTDYGTISKISYGATNVVSEGASAASAIASVIAARSADPTDAQLATALKDQADKIYQQNRAAVCIARPADCSK